jgi:uncharacterized integral membrane protein
MKKPLNIILIILAIALIAYNVTEVNFENLFEGDSIVALICIAASLCAIVLLMIYMTSRKIQNAVKKD